MPRKEKKFNYMLKEIFWPIELHINNNKNDLLFLDVFDDIFLFCIFKRIFSSPFTVHTACTGI